MNDLEKLALKNSCEINEQIKRLQNKKLELFQLINGKAPNILELKQDLNDIDKLLNDLRYNNEVDEEILKGGINGR